MKVVVVVYLTALRPARGCGLSGNTIPRREEFATCHVNGWSGSVVLILSISKSTDFCLLCNIASTRFLPENDNSSKPKTRSEV